MRILSESELSTRPVSNNPPETALEKSRICLDQKDTETEVTGAILEAAVHWKDRYLVFMTDDIPSEDSLRIHLLDEKGVLLDSVTLGAMYVTGSFSSLELIEPNTIRFQFIDDMNWKLVLFDEPKYRFPFFSEPKGVSRRLGLKHCFSVLGEPVSERV